MVRAVKVFMMARWSKLANCPAAFLSFFFGFVMKHKYKDQTESNKSAELRRAINWVQVVQTVPAIPMDGPGDQASQGGPGG